MKPLNQKERRRGFLTVLLFFIPMIGVAVLAMSFQHEVRLRHLGDLELKKEQYEYALQAQARKGLMMEEVLNGLKLLRAEKDMGFLQHQRTQKEINKKLNAITEIQLLPSDTTLPRIRRVPAVYDSLVKSVKYTQYTRDSIKTSNTEIANLKFQLEQCLKSLGEQLAEEDGEGGKP